MRSVILIACAVVLSGCIPANKPVDQMSYSELVEVAKRVDQRCADQGVKKGDPRYDLCIKQEATRETSRRRALYNLSNSPSITCNRIGSATICN